MLPTVLWFGVVFSSIYITNGQSLGGYCRTPTGESAKCMNIYQCDPIISLLRLERRSEEQTRFVKASQCGRDSRGQVYVCCGSGFNTVTTGSTDPEDTDFVPNPLIPDRSKCGIQETNKIFGGTRAAFDEYPWLALIEYVNPNGQHRLSCGASLINQRYVLTAAHCLVNLPSSQPLSVRLGEYNITSPGTDCYENSGIRVCNNPEINAGIEEIVAHPGYSAEKHYNDIALIRLDRNVQYSNFIRPICLPSPSDSLSTGTKLTVAGWGRTETSGNSEVKLKVEVPLVDREVCSNNYRQKYQANLTDKHLCAGGEAGKDSCKGDSGGPLMRSISGELPTWVVEGIVSFGPPDCGNVYYPGVYTKVSKYLSWIHKNVRE